MAQKLGEAYIEVNADMSKLGPQLQLATNQVNSSLGVMKTHFMTAEQLSKKAFTVAKMGALAAGAAMLVASKQGQHLIDAFGALNQAVVDLTIGPVLEKIAHAVELLAKNMSQLGFLGGFEKTFSTETEFTIIAIAGAIMGALIPALQAKIQAIWASIPAWSALAEAIWAAMAPLLPYILATAAVAVAAYAVWKYWDQIVAFLSTSWNWLWSQAVSIFNGIVNAITSAWNWIVNTTTSIWNGIKAFFQQWGMTLLVVLFPVFGFIVATIINNWDKIKAWTQSAWNAIKSFLSSVWNSIKAAVAPIFNPIAQFIQNAWNKVKSTSSSVWSGIKSWLSSTWNSIKSAASSIWNSVTSAISSAWNSLKSTASSIWSGIYNTIAGWIKRVLGKLRPFINGFNSVVSKVNSLTGAKLPTISMPGLAKGGIVTAPTMALVGEGRYHEAVLPLSDKTFGALAEGITSRMNGGGGNTVVNVYPQKAEIDEYDLANIIRRQQWTMGV